MNGEPLKLARGQQVLIGYEGREVPGTVVLCSSNGVSVMLSFDAMLGGYVGMMPVLWTEGGYQDLVASKPVTLALGQQMRSL